MEAVHSNEGEADRGSMAWRGGFRRVLYLDESPPSRDMVEVLESHFNKGIEDLHEKHVVALIPIVVMNGNICVNDVVNLAVALLPDMIIWDDRPYVTSQVELADVQRALRGLPIFRNVGMNIQPDIDFKVWEGGEVSIKKNQISASRTLF